MKLSFVIPAFNEETYILACLHSLIKELDQTRYDTEIIVVNNGSTDHTEEVVKSFFGITVIAEPVKGLARARHTGFMISTGDLIANIDADTRLPSGWIERVVQEFQLNSNLVALSGPFIYHDLPMIKRILVRIYYYLGFGLHLINHRILKIGAMLQGGNFVLRRTALRNIGGYDPQFEFYGEDSDVARRIQELGDVKFTFKLPIYSSARRLKKEGVGTMAIRYALNHFWTIYLKRPYTKTAHDIRG
jgi:glycosyltransferase involved in cell wall biosynthesis